MPRELLIFRHGKTDRSSELDRFERPLKDGGKRDAQRMGVWLAAHDLLPDQVLASPAEHATVSAQKCCKVMGLTAGHVHRDRRLYDAPAAALLEVLAECPPTAQRVMLVGHNPGLEELLSYLVDRPVDLAEDEELLPTASLARLALSADWQQLADGCASLMDLVRPASLPRMFPYPSPHGEGRRKRPAYYYTQSSVIPYRLRDGLLEVLVIASSKSKHPVIPKGIQDPGLSPQDSAAKEAEEEAGVEGDVAEEPIGSYSYDKWGATCTVTVYPMRVTRTLPEHEWEENHRGRRWMSPTEAAERLRQRALAPMVLALADRLRAPQS